MGLTGNCNRCGACCWVDDFKCTNLNIEDGRTSCLVYGDRKPGMPIILTNNQGEWKDGFCNHTLPVEEEILTRLIKQGACSLEVSDG